jgi:flagellar biosynthesis protein FlhG
VEARSRTIAFTSGKGGVGKSSLVLNTAVLLARRGRRVAVLDGDLGLANLHLLLGQTPKHDLRHVVAGERALGDVLVPGPEGIVLIPAAAGVAELANLDAEAREELLRALRELGATVDFLLIDTGAGLSDTVLDLIVASDEAVVVTRPEPTALADAYALMKVVVQQQASYPFHVLVNMARDARQAEQIYRSLAQILLRFLGYRPGYAGHVLDDPAVVQAVLQQVPFAIQAPRTSATRCLDRLAAALTGAAPPRPPAAAGFWERLVAGRRGRP